MREMVSRSTFSCGRAETAETIVSNRIWYRQKAFLGMRMIFSEVTKARRKRELYWTSLPVGDLVRMDSHAIMVGRREHALQKPQFALAFLLVAYARLSTPLFGGASFAFSSQPFR